MTEPYITSVRALSTLIYSVADTDYSPAYFHHCFENNLDAVPDMLARLGILKADQHGHKFCFDWQPNQHLPILRHEGEPTLEDLGIGLDFAVAWYGATSYFRRNEGRIHSWPQQGLVKAAVFLGRGEMVDGRYCPYDERGEDIIQQYRENRNRLEKRLGSEQDLFPERTK
ncbi:hypothetical protein [Qipengyuania aquimaris]|uniref:Uncharacterized protein n=1 Tax=Qipengyuania aquimaris TaxID=255984 RepID=A0A9Q3S156_9SPHN|nr:hypothetical protein [Qipengyuania aquimaris]MBY6218046.1 hypothetical protein [Qipengyuania aquimaris]